MIHCLGQDVRPESAGQTGGNRLIEEQPDVPAGAASRSFQQRGKLHLTTRIKKRSGVFLPTILVEISSQEETRFITEHRIEPHNKIPPGIVLSGQMPTDHFIRDREKSAIRALRTFHRPFVAYPPNPLVGAGRRISALARPATFKPASVNILPPAKQRTKQHDLRLGRR